MDRILKLLESFSVTNLLVEGGGETHAQFFEQNVVNRIAFFYAPKILGGRAAAKAVGGTGLPRGIKLADPEWTRFGPDQFLTACIEPNTP